MFETYRAAPPPLGNALAYLNAAFLAEHAIRVRKVEEFLVGRSLSKDILLDWGSMLLFLGGHSKELSEVVTGLYLSHVYSSIYLSHNIYLLIGFMLIPGVFVIQSIDLETFNCCIMKTSGKEPIARGGKYGTLVGSRLIMFGGEDSSRRSGSNRMSLYICFIIYQLQSLIWRSLIFLLLEWSQPHIEGDLVTPRAGQAGITINEDWHLVGGEDFRSGVSDTLMLKMSKLVWSVVTRVKERDPLASEGLTVCSEIVYGEKVLVAFGGYYGKYNNEVYVLRTKPKDLSRPKIFQSAAAATSVTAAYALTSSGERKIDIRKKEDANFQEMEIETSSARRFHRRSHFSRSYTTSDQGCFQHNPRCIEVVESLNYISLEYSSVDASLQLLYQDCKFNCTTLSCCDSRRRTWDGELSQRTRFRRIEIVKVASLPESTRSIGIWSCTAGAGAVVVNQKTKGNRKWQSV
ncbi:hypothetical protein MKX03_032498 [Papaver bracteatum]|nr:hypothetical protein MKX03_032498 [Papaver bracteatum]